MAGVAALSRNAHPHQSYLRCQGGNAGRRRDSGVSRRSRVSLRRTAAAARMSRSARIDLSSEHRRWVLGSRATGRARRYSDLDLAIDAGRPLTLDETARLAEAFSDSDLPYRVDVVDWHAIDDRFRGVIAGERVALAEAAHPDAAIGGEPGTSSS